MRNFLCCYHRWLITSLAIEKCKKKTIFFKLFWYKVFVHSKLKLLNFLVDSVLTFADVGGARMAQWCKHSPPTNMVQIQNLASMPYVGWVCCLFSPLLWEVLSPITNTSKFHLIWNTHTLVSAPWVNKWEFFFYKMFIFWSKNGFKRHYRVLMHQYLKDIAKKKHHLKRTSPWSEIWWMKQHTNKNQFSLPKLNRFLCKKCRYQTWTTVAILSKCEC